MTEDMEPKALEKECLRVALDRVAAQSYLNMVERLKAENTFIKIQPSQFVSFLVADFFKTYFEKDLAVLVAEFFDSDSYYESERHKARGAANYEEALETALARARAVKAKKRGNAVRKVGRPPKSKAMQSDEAL